MCRCVRFFFPIDHFEFLSYYTKQSIFFEYYIIYIYFKCYVISNIYSLSLSLTLYIIYIFFLSSFEYDGDYIIFVFLFVCLFVERLLVESNESSSSSSSSSFIRDKMASSDNIHTYTHRHC